jgi:hypothetical protein
MELFSKLVNGYGQISYSVLKDFVSHCSLADFTAQSPYPFLVGKDLYEGQLKPKIGGSLSSTSTLRFNAAEFRPISPTDSKIGITEELGRNPADSREKEKNQISHNVYVLRKKNLPGSTESSNIITIGRTGMNDIVLADTVVSGKHALIHIENGMFFVEDLNSTNGTKVNYRKIAPQQKVQLPLNATVDFGRLSFVFAHPLQVYRTLRKEIVGY